MTIGTLFILVGVVILFTLSIGIILGHRSRKIALMKKTTDSVVEVLDEKTVEEEVI